MKMTTTKEKNGFVSQRNFQRYMAEFYENEQADSSVADPVSRDLLSSGSMKGRKGEYIVKGMLEDMGYECRMLNGFESCDIMVKIDGKWLGVEVKTGSMSSANQYNFQKIKTFNFDLIALVFVGKDYTGVKIGGKKAKHFIDAWGTTQEEGQKIAFNAHRMNKRLRGRDDVFMDCVANNIPKLIAQ